MSKKRKAPDAALDMTPMIDVVFQLIIFFITTIDMENKALETQVRMAMSPNGPVEEKKDPRTVTVDVEKDGTIKINQAVVTPALLKTILTNARIATGGTTPVVIRGDGDAQHRDIQKVMAVVGSAGLWKIRFAALKEKA
jgi:biopolymer transport protein ExbD